MTDSRHAQLSRRLRDDEELRNRRRTRESHGSCAVSIFVLSHPIIDCLGVIVVAVQILTLAFFRGVGILNRDDGDDKDNLS